MKTVLMVTLLVFSATIQAQTPSTTEIEPAVNTSAPVPQTAPKARAAAPANAAVKPGSSKPAGKAMDRLELEATQITGNRELPKVMYVVPWRRADLGDLQGRPANSLLDEALTPVDRDVFRRQSQYYQALQPDGVAATPAPGKDER